MARIPVALICPFLIVLVFVAQQCSANSGEYTNVRAVRRMSKGCALWGQACLGGHFKKRSNINSPDIQDVFYPWRNSQLNTPPLFDDTETGAAGDIYNNNPLNNYPWNAYRFRRSIRV
ncbi:uncharacterized protein LOC129596210 [Paramacrobiotus metropolitanus]|uniref:uncharacterized protein LOC129596210 n=1 Tax=Paramacrobiotus metropolitanus TaxID=2943436 RepID=UPI0024460B51|nr:uncharacterized protein LOC129596210 [Paramacrobiotus metropolitanus]